MSRFDELLGAPLVPLPAQPAGVAWPTGEWPRGSTLPAVAELVDEAFGRPAELGTTFAVVVVQGGRIVAERYGGELENWTGPNVAVTAETPLLSWSMAKSMLHAAVGPLVAEGRLALDEPVAVPEWSAPGDPRGGITLEHLLDMRDGLDFAEDYVDDRVSDVIEMLFGSGASDVAGFAVGRPPAAPPGERFNYSSGTSNIVSRLVRDVVGRGQAYRDFVRARVFEAIGMASADPRFDEAGTWVASSYVHATAQDFARFGLLYLRDGMWDGRRVLPEGWVDHARALRSVDPTDGRLYGAHWWIDDDGFGTFRAAGYEGQAIVVCPALDAVVVRLGKTPADLGDHLPDWRARMVAALAR